jgi:hypothetical protein
MPHSAFRGETPDEVFFGTALNLAAELDDARSKARERRLAANRSAFCARCAPAAGPIIRCNCAHAASAYAIVRDVLVRSRAFVPTLYKGLLP